MHSMAQQIEICVQSQRLHINAHNNRKQSGINFQTVNNSKILINKSNLLFNICLEKSNKNNFKKMQRNQQQSSRSANVNIDIRKIIRDCEIYEREANMTKNKSQKSQKFKEIDVSQYGELAKIDKIESTNSSPNKLKLSNFRDIKSISGQKSRRSESKADYLPKINKSTLNKRIPSQNAFLTNISLSAKNQQKQQSQNLIKSQHNNKYNSLSSDNIHNNNNINKAYKKQTEIKRIQKVIQRYKQHHYPSNASKNIEIDYKQEVISNNKKAQKSERQSMQKMIKYLNNSPINKVAILPNYPMPSQLDNINKIVKVSSRARLNDSRLKTEGNDHRYGGYSKVGKHKYEKSQFLMVNPSQINSYDQILQQRKKKQDFQRISILKTIIRDNIKKKLLQNKKNSLKHRRFLTQM